MKIIHYSPKTILCVPFQNKVNKVRTFLSQNKMCKAIFIKNQLIKVIHNSLKTMKQIMYQEESFLSKMIL